MLHSVVLSQIVKEVSLFLIFSPGRTIYKVLMTPNVTTKRLASNTIIGHHTGKLWQMPLCCQTNHHLWRIFANTCMWVNETSPQCYLGCGRNQLECLVVFMTKDLLFPKSLPLDNHRSFPADITTWKVLIVWGYIRGVPPFESHFFIWLHWVKTLQEPCYYLLLRTFSQRGENWKGNVIK